jgi:hypothetical protein
MTAVSFLQYLQSYKNIVLTYDQAAIEVMEDSGGRRNARMHTIGFVVMAANGIQPSRYHVARQI